MKKGAWFLIGAVFSFSFVSWHQPVQAQTYPAQPIQMVITLSPGDTVDLAGRTIGALMAKILKIPVVIVNKPGGGGTLGAESVVRSKKDGYTLLFTATAPLVYPRVFDPKSLPYDVDRDLEPLGGRALVPFTVTVQESSPWRTL